MFPRVGTAAARDLMHWLIRRSSKPWRNSELRRTYFVTRRAVPAMSTSKDSEPLLWFSGERASTSFPRRPKSQAAPSAAAAVPVLQHGSVLLDQSELCSRASGHSRAEWTIDHAG